jgi:hypothetical protein
MRNDGIFVSGTTTNAVTITGLPFTAKTVTNGGWGGSIGFTSTSWVQVPIYISIDQATAFINLYKTNIVPIKGSDMAGGGLTSYFQCTITYQTT